VTEALHHSTQSGWRRIPPALLILGLGAVLIAGLFVLKPAPRTMPPQEVGPPQVAVIFAKPQAQALSVNSQGTVTPRREIDLVVQVAGKVRWVNEKFVSGGFFDAGEALLEVEAQDYRFALTRAQARVAEAEQLLATEKGRAYQAKREWRDLGNAEANELFLRTPQLAAAEANVAAAIADSDKAKLDLERTKVTVPFTGRVRETSVDLGQYVSPGSRVARVYDTSVAVIRLPLTDSQAALVELPLGFQGSDDNLGPAVLISGIIGGERYQWHGRITRTDASIDVNSRMYYAVAEVANPFVESADKVQVPLIIGLFVEAQINGREIADVITVPRRALFKNTQLYTLDDKNIVRMKNVRVLATTRDEAWIKGDIASGEAIVTSGQNFILPGLEVSPQPAHDMFAAKEQ
jgi:RND family efflux transporter MFP subunit